MNKINWKPTILLSMKLKQVYSIYALDFDHPIKLENFKLVNKSNKYEIKIVESILIHKLGPNINDRGSSFPLSILQWTNLREFNFTFI